MADFADVAADYSEKLLEQQLERAKLAAALPVGEGAAECVECGDEIPPARRQALPGCVTCVDCQSLREVRRG